MQKWTRIRPGSVKYYFRGCFISRTRRLLLGANGWPGKYGRGALVRKPPQREAWKEILFFALLNCLQTVELAIAALERHKVVIFSNNTDTKQVCTPLRGPGDFKELFASGIQTAALVLTLFAELGKCCRGLFFCFHEKRNSGGSNGLRSSGWSDAGPGLTLACPSPFSKVPALLWTKQGRGTSSQKMWLEWTLSPKTVSSGLRARSAHFPELDASVQSLFLGSASVSHETQILRPWHSAWLVPVPSFHEPGLWVREAEAGWCRGTCTRAEPKRRPALNGITGMWMPHWQRDLENIS